MIICGSNHNFIPKTSKFSYIAWARRSTRPGNPKNQLSHSNSKHCSQSPLPTTKNRSYCSGHIVFISLSHHRSSLWGLATPTCFSLPSQLASPITPMHCLQDITLWQKPNCGICHFCHLNQIPFGKLSRQTHSSCLVKQTKISMAFNIWHPTTVPARPLIISGPISMAF